VSWLIGFVLGVLGGFVLGSLAGPSALSGLRRSVGQAHGGAADGNGGRRRGGRLTGLPHDEQLARAARERLAERGLANPRVDVTIVDGVAYLRGRARDAADVTAIVETVQQMPGLTGVVNELKVPEAATS
jgi:osmotically-inducible protein OsmY